MNKSIFRLITATLTFLMLTACSATPTPESIEETLRQAEAALAKGDMTVAHSVASHMTDSLALDNMSVSQLGRLSMIFMQVADSIDQTANTETATDIYDRAYRIDADSADRFYNSVEPERMQFVETLTGNSSARRNPVDMSKMDSDSCGFDQKYDQNNTRPWTGKTD